MCKPDDFGHSSQRKPESPCEFTIPYKRRFALWEVPGNLQCSIIGTCFSHADILKIARRVRIEIPAKTPEYDVHAHFVNEACSDTKSARFLQKELDRRHAGMLRRVSRLSDEKELQRLWTESYVAGRIAGAYWAIVSHTHVPAELRTRVFGEVHMLSHLLGRKTHAQAVQADDLSDRVQELEARLKRESDRHRSAIEERDRRLSYLSSRCRQPVRELQCPASSLTAQAGRDRRFSRLLTRKERALAVARQRARLAEEQVEGLTRQLRTLQANSRRAALGNRPASGCPGAEACAIDLPPRTVLYLGGRQSSMEQLRNIAREANADMVHHDGGVEQTVELIDGLVSRCDAVFCPIDCISHGACERAKKLCRKHRKPFVPLRSSGSNSFKRALLDLRCQD